MKVRQVGLESTLLTRLTSLSDPPKNLYIRGNFAKFSQIPTLAVVGSRKVTPYGRLVTMQLVRELVAAGVGIISGLALGVDSIAHQTTVSAGGLTMAVLGSGIENIYPLRHTRLAEAILQTSGAVVSEYPGQTPGMPYHFIARNRLIAALSDAVLITEAAEHSGSLHTANFALDLGKPVLAVPGNITSPLSAGTNNLIKGGAAPVTETADILEALGLSGATGVVEVQAANLTEAAILDLIKKGVTDGAELLTQSKLSTADFNQALTMLEITAKIRSLGAGHWSLR